MTVSEVYKIISPRWAGSCGGGIDVKVDASAKQSRNDYLPKGETCKVADGNPCPQQLPARLKKNEPRTNKKDHRGESHRHLGG